MEKEPDSPPPMFGQNDFFDEDFEVEESAEDLDRRPGGDDPFQRLLSSENENPELDSAEDRFDAADDWEKEDDYFDVNPTSILESMLFVGNAENEPLTAKEMSALMRGVSEDDISELVAGLNQTYADEGSPFVIVLENGGYQMVLRPEFESTRQKFYRAEKPAQLSQSVLDVLSLVAYLQPVTKTVIESKKFKPCGSMLGQLVRRRLVQLERVKEKGKKTEVLYRTTDRFLELFGLDSLDDLPKSQTFESPG